MTNGHGPYETCSPNPETKTHHGPPTVEATPKPASDRRRRKTPEKTVNRESVRQRP